MCNSLHQDAYVVYDDDPILVAALKRSGMVLTADGWKHKDEIEADDFDGLLDAVRQGVEPMHVQFTDADHEAMESEVPGAYLTGGAL